MFVFVVCVVADDLFMDPKLSCLSLSLLFNLLCYWTTDLEFDIFGCRRGTVSYCNLLSMEQANELLL